MGAALGDRGGVETFAVKAPIYCIACGQNEDT